VNEAVVEWPAERQLLIVAVYRCDRKRVVLLSANRGRHHVYIRIRLPNTGPVQGQVNSDQVFGRALAKARPLGGILRHGLMIDAKFLPNSIRARARLRQRGDLVS